MSRNNPFKGAKFERLRQEWNRRLAESGFIDAEDSVPGYEPLLKILHSKKFIPSRPRDHANPEGLEDYYRLAQGLLHRGFSFETDISRRIWELHVEGRSVRKIERILQDQLLGYKGRKKTTVCDIIRGIQIRSGIKR